MNAKGIFVQTTLYGIDSLKEIVRTGLIGKNSQTLGYQIPMFRESPLSFCSYVCPGYPEVYGNNEGIVFETEFPVVYACPADTFELMRNGSWLPGYERFIFPSVEDMLKKYPTSFDFKKDFQEFFKKLKPSAVYREADFISRKDAERMHKADYCLERRFLESPRCNEITFQKPTRVKNCRIFQSIKDIALAI
jgi:hypothetical protein